MDIITLLKEKGIKITPQRIAIIKYLQESRNHPTAEEIYNALINQYPMMSLATIYNTLELLTNLELVEKIKIKDEETSNYDYKKEPHHHFYCKKCKRIFDVIYPGIIEKNFNEEFLVEETVIYFKGYCKNCKKIYLEGGNEKS